VRTVYCLNKMEGSYKIIILILIYLIVPLAGLFFYNRLRKKVIAANIPHPPVSNIFIVFFTYGGLLILTLTECFADWSGLASVGTFYLILLAPIAMLIIAYKQYPTRQLSVYNKWVFNCAVSYCVIAPIVLWLLIHFSKTDV
jgi:hypothetical protein